MFAFLLIASSALFSETSTSLGKYAVRRRLESIYTMGFLNTLWSAGSFAAIAILFPHAFRFSAASLPTLVPRIILECLQIVFSLKAIALATRSTNGLVRSATIPLLLLVDLALGYPMAAVRIAGILIIFFMLLFLFANHGVERKGIWFVIGSAVNAVATISLYKYDIAHFNSVVAEQLIVVTALLLFLFVSDLMISRQNPFRLLAKPILLGQSATYGFGSVLSSFAYQFGPASLIVSFDRSLSVLWSIIFGHKYFREKHLVVKLVGAAGIVVGLVLLTR